jgi:uncharacterized protein (DUF2164 family)
MSDIKLSSEQKKQAVGKLKQYFDSEMRQDLGQFEAEFLLDFIGQELGAYFYNQGLKDAGALMDKKLEDIQQHLYEMEKYTD